jgi:hypothetical protein
LQRKIRHPGAPHCANGNLIQESYRVKVTTVVSIDDTEGAIMMFNAFITLPVKEFVSELLIFTYSIAHYLGSFVIYVFGLAIPQYNLHKDLADPLGFLAVITGFLILYRVAQKIAWGVLIVGWIFVAIRVLIVLFE